MPTICFDVTEHRGCPSFMPIKFWGTWLWSSKHEKGWWACPLNPRISTSASLLVLSSHESKSCCGCTFPASCVPPGLGMPMAAMSWVAVAKFDICEKCISHGHKYSLIAPMSLWNHCLVLHPSSGRSVLLRCSPTSFALFAVLKLCTKRVRKASQAGLQWQLSGRAPHGPLYQKSSLQQKSGCIWKYMPKFDGVQSFSLLEMAMNLGHQNEDSRGAQGVPVPSRSSACSWWVAFQAHLAGISRTCSSHPFVGWW